MFQRLIGQWGVERKCLGDGLDFWVVGEKEATKEMQEEREKEGGGREEKGRGQGEGSLK